MLVLLEDSDVVEEETSVEEELLVLVLVLGGLGMVVDVDEDASSVAEEL